MSATRRFAVVDGNRRVDLVVPVEVRLGDALVSAGLERGTRLPVLRDGVSADLDAPVATIVDGALLAVVDPSAPTVRRRAQVTGTRRSRVAVWWLLAAVGAVVVAVACTSPTVTWQPRAVPVLAVGSLVSALAAARRDAARSAGAIRVVGPAALGVAAVVAATPRGHAGTVQLAVVLGGLAVVALLAVVVAVDPETLGRTALVAVAVILTVVAATWMLVLELGWDARVAAAVVVGAVPLGVRALPSSVLDVPDGSFVDFERFMRTRWSVRGAVPQPPGLINKTTVGTTVQAAMNARIAGTVLLSVLGTVALPVAVPALSTATLVRSGQIALLTCYATSMTLLGRSTGIRNLHWAPRLSAAVATVVGARLLLPTLGGEERVLVALLALVAGVVAAALAVVVGRGGSSVALSRIGDWCEALTLTLSLPAALLAADVIDAVRSLVA